MSVLFDTASLDPEARPDLWSEAHTRIFFPIAVRAAAEDLSGSRIEGHALAVATPDACAGWFAWPAQRTDGSSADRDCLPEGAHLRLDPKLDLASLHLPPIALSIARAMQRYGMIIRDTTHSAFAFYAEDPTTGADPYDGPRGVFDGLQEWQFLPLIPWNRLQLLALARCSSVPCVSPRGPRR